MDPHNDFDKHDRTLEAENRDLAKEVVLQVRAVTDLRWTLDNIYTLARLEQRRDDPRGRWGHVLRLCEKAGCQGRGVLRDNGGTVAPEPPQEP